MKNIKYIWLFLFIGIASFKMSAQKRMIEAGITVGYGFPAGTATYTSSSISGNFFNQSVASYSLGSGINIGLNGTYFFNDHIGAGLNIHYLAGAPSGYTYQSPGPVGGPPSIINNHVTNSAVLMAAVPYMMFIIPIGKISPYGKFGIDVYSATITSKLTQDGNDAAGGTFIETYTGNVGLGYYCGLGVQYALSDKISLDAELFDRIMSFSPFRGVNTQAFDGDQKEQDVTYVQTLNHYTPNTFLATDYPFSSAGIMVGISMKFGVE